MLTGLRALAAGPANTDQTGSARGSTLEATGLAGIAADRPRTPRTKRRIECVHWDLFANEERDSPAAIIVGSVLVVPRRARLLAPHGRAIPG